jgi:probable ATP-dependent RNA helicase DDX4
VPKPEGLDSGVEPGPPRESYVPAEFLEGDAIFDERNQLYEGTGINFKDYDNIAVNASDGNGPLQVVNYQTFSEMGLRMYLVENLTKCKYTKPTPVQRAAIPILLNDRDIMACAQTGSGKTAAFLLPILHKLLSNQAEISQAGVMPATPEALILAPTRELALQIGKEANAYAAGSIVKTKVMYGGVPVYSNKTNLQRGCNICVATPGKLKQLVREGHLSLANVRFFILDEADRMLDMGFMEDVNEIVTTMPGKGDKISGMFSATFPDAIQQVAKKFLEDYVFISVGVVGGACKDVEQVFETLEQKEKRNKLLDILKNTPKDNYKIVVFCGTKKGADFLATVLSDKQISSTSIHGDRLQSQREAALREFASGQRKVLVATAVAARGLDIPKVSMVINYDMPKEIEEYVHRIGRTGRVGHQGKAISFFDLQNDAPIAAPLVDILKGAGQPVPEFLEKIGSSGGGYGGDFGGVDSRGGCENGAAGGGGDDDWD